ncbi:hypothetical protein PTSG_04636 [Salpingoeca rosetta]|uniref:TM7S3/TM198-like domain-containing protein n=1 Tax=Salpingoeca rosetta (strain ATCC 50818 / BSB-021) TaxID=946362 RepID=F2U802_SALR5|nr:uncharacterized protein PTSG_04636 [Salpingoeca rosetta]EGD72907.1 hypothetical protein PTSG_04636 [Salpingoeca rosetta]|eukprot:XP_004994729.1 hypothetical protein PTSG_04636 [Salpingoeca rosetta]
MLKAACGKPSRSNGSGIGSVVSKHRAVHLQAWPAEKHRSPVVRLRRRGLGLLWMAGLIVAMACIAANARAAPAPPRTDMQDLPAASSEHAKEETSRPTESVGHEDGQFAIPDVMSDVKNANWTAWVARVRDPANRSYVVAVAMCADLAVIFAGYDFLRLWLFMGGFVTAAGTFFFFSPEVLDFDMCCGPGTENARAVVSVVLGLLAGAMALWVLRAGIFLTGSCLGLVLSLFIKGFLTRVGVSNISADTIALVYVVVGLGYYQHCHFTEVIEVVHEHLRHHDRGAHAPSASEPHLEPCDDILLGIWVLLSFAGAAFQFGSCSSKEDQQHDLHHRRQRGNGHAHHAAPLVLVRSSSSKRSGRRRGAHAGSRNGSDGDATGVQRLLRASSVRQGRRGSGGNSTGSGGGSGSRRARRRGGRHRVGDDHPEVSLFSGLQHRGATSATAATAQYQPLPTHDDSGGGVLQQHDHHHHHHRHHHRHRHGRDRKMTARQRRREERLLRTYGPHILVSSSSEEREEDSSLLEDYRDTS